MVIAELADILDKPGIIVAVEWPETARDVLPADRLSLNFTVSGDDERTIEITATGPKSEAVLKGIKP